MTALPPPPSSAGSPPPPPPPSVPPSPPAPPPPPPPPGLLQRNASIAPVQHATLDRVGKLATAVVVLVAVSATMSVVAIWAGETAQDDARALLDDTITAEQFVERAAPYLLMSVVQAVATVAAAVVTMIWMFRLAKNHRTLHRGGTWGPGWAIGGWFLPPLLFVIPFLMFRELWKASDPDSAVGDDWRGNTVTWLVPAWFVLYSLFPVGLLIAQTSSGFALGASERDMAQQVIDNQGLTVASAIVAVAGAAVFVLLVRQLTARHRQLTGEAAV